MVALQTTILACALLGGGDAVLLDFHADWCGPCRQMAPIVDQLSALGYPIRKVNVDQNRELAARHKVSGIPCFVLVVDGQEAGRTVGVASSDRLKSMFEKAGVGPGSARRQAAAPSGDGSPALPVARAQSPDPAAEPRGIPLPGQVSRGPLGEPQATSSPGDPFAADNGPAPASVVQSAGGKADIAQLVASSVRLRIDDATGHSYGTGTIIDARDGQALVLTCGHIFRDSDGKGRITIDLFGPGAPQGLPGQIVSYDYTKSDVGLVSFRPGTRVAVARVAPLEYRVGAGDRVTSVGCDNGTEPQARQSHVTSIDKYLGPPNVQVAGQPVQGRSGGGLFNESGLVIGVCNAADPADNEGLYAGPGSIQALLDQAGLASVYQSRPAQPSASDAQLAGPLVPVRAPQMPEQMPRSLPAMPLTNDREDNAASLAQVSGPAREQGPLPRAPQGLSSQEQAALEALRGQAGAEVVCVIRSLADPRAKSQIIVLDRASPAFLQQLAAEQRKQAGRELTSLAVTRPSGTTREQTAQAPNAKANGAAVNGAPRPAPRGVQPAANRAPAPNRIAHFDPRWNQPLEK